MKRVISIILCVLLLSTAKTFAQQVLTKEQAIAIALENNYDIVLSKKNLEIAKNNADFLNSGYLPTVFSRANATYNSNDSEVEFESGDTRSVSGAESENYSASIGVNYILFNGLGRYYTHKRLKEVYNISSLQARAVLENTLLTLFQAYYEVARLYENVAQRKATLAISKMRYQRSNYELAYGQNNKLSVLNAKVDVSNDSIAYLTAERELENATRDLNLVMGRDVDTEFRVTTDVLYAADLNLATLLQQAKAQNVNYLQAEKNVNLGVLDRKIARAPWMPQVSLTSSYAWSQRVNDATTPFSPISNSQNGINAGITLNWDLFDGGSTQTRMRNAQITEDRQKIAKVQQWQTLQRDLKNAWSLYKNALFTLQVQEDNVKTSTLNFERSEEYYKLGQLTNIDFRTAQNNLLNVELNYSTAKYNAKNAELRLLQLSGTLLSENNW
ncbi:MAG: TolC family protein [Flavicella sp.]